MIPLEAVHVTTLSVFVLYIITTLGYVTNRQGMDWILDLLTTCIHHSETTLYRSLIHTTSVLSL
jgi:hypothetical protein